ASAGWPRSAAIRAGGRCPVSSTTASPTCSTPGTGVGDAGSACFPELPLRPKPEGLLEPLGISRPHLRIDDAGRALAVERHDQLLGGDAAHIGARLARHARG